MSSRHDALIARNISKAYGETVVLDGVSLVVGPGSRTGVVGPNGIGKSTLLRVLAGVEPPDSGTVERQPPGARVAYLEQSTDSGQRSGGEAARERLAAVIAGDPDVLLLDEPTNDLDFAGLARLAEALAGFRGGLVAVSHDRAFLAGMTRILEFEAETRRVRVYAGGWAEFEAERRRVLEAEARAYRDYSTARDRVVERARRKREWNERGYGQGRKKKKTKDARKAFEQELGRLERVEKPWSPWRLELDLDAASRPGAIVARLERAVVGRGDFRLGPVDLEIAHGDRVVVRGDNGAGKTTLLRSLLGELPLLAGNRWVGPSTVFGQLPQGPGPFAGPERAAAHVRRRDRPARGRGPRGAREVRPRRRRRPSRRRVAVARGAHPRRARGAGRARRERAGPRRADQPPRPRGDRAARGGPRRLRRRDRARQPRPALPRRLRGDDHVRRRRAHMRGVGWCSWGHAEGGRSERS